jgi:hypothetical protein
MLASFHFYWSTQGTPNFVLPERPGARQGTVIIEGIDVDQPMRDFAASFNGYVDEQNNSSRNQNIASGCGYILAFLTAIFSLYLELAPRNDAGT